MGKKVSGLMTEVQEGTSRTIFAKWTFSEKKVDHFDVRWYYDTGNQTWFLGSDSDVKVGHSTYNAPDNARRVYVKVCPVSKKRKVNGKDVSYWTGDWVRADWTFADSPPLKPPMPTIEIKNLKLTVKVTNVQNSPTYGKTTHIEFYIVRNTSKFADVLIPLTATDASYSCNVTAGATYKVCCRAVSGKGYSEWTDYTDSVGTSPAATGGIHTIRALSETSVYLAWDNGLGATGWNIEYTTNRDYFDSSGEVKSLSVTGVTHCEVTGLESGQEYFFRVQATNENGESGWSNIVSIIIGKSPSAPTTWSNTTTAIVGEELTLYWAHNSEDGSSERYAQIELEINGNRETHDIKNTASEDEKDRIGSYKIDTSVYREGTVILWRVRTSGITNQYGDWSIQRRVDVYAPPTLVINMTDQTGTDISTLSMFPFYVSGEAGPNTQTPIGYSLSIISNNAYETVDDIGNVKMVNAGEAVFDRHFDTDEDLLVEFSPGNINLEAGMEYTIQCVVSMNSGLTATATQKFDVSWTDDVYDPDIEIGIDNDVLTALLRPYCEDENGKLVEDVTLSVYRREFDGSFTELATGLKNTNNTYITDPHPALDYARYRVVAVGDKTGAVSFYDPPGYPLGEKAVVIQWAEAWTSFETSNSDEMEEPTWSGSMLKLPYNIDVSENTDPDVSLIEYIGRQHPVSYYGTQKGVTATWNMDVPLKDEETIYRLRRLAVYMGDVYVREPSGTGYWANVKVSFNQKHKTTVAPVTINITRVEGGA